VAPRVQSVGAGVNMDLIFVIGTVAFFALSLEYVSGCDRL
jgi:hypothetical protein